MRPVPVLLYHSVDDDPHPDVARWSVTLQQFVEHMAVLRQGGWRTITMTEMTRLTYAGVALPDRCVAVTFDDGFEDTLTRAMPAMDDMVGTAYVTSGWLRDRGDGVGAPGRMLSRGQLTEITDGGWEVGVHGHRHVALDAVSRTTASRDIAESKMIVDDALGVATTSFAYPYGYHDRHVQGFVREAGFGHAVGVKNAHSHALDDRWGIARITVERGMSATWLERTLLEPMPPTAPPKEQLRTTTWRQVRRVRAALAGIS